MPLFLLLPGIGVLVMNSVILFFSSICILVGFVGCVVPSIPGPPLSLLALIILDLKIPQSIISVPCYMVLGSSVGIVTLLDYALPFWGARFFGGSRYGIWGSVIGAVAGIVFFPPFGVFFGALCGAIVGEIVGGYHYRQALCAGMGIFVASMVVVGLKLIVSGIVSYVFIKSILTCF